MLDQVPPLALFEGRPFTFLFPPFFRVPLRPNASSHDCGCPPPPKPNRSLKNQCLREPVQSRWWPPRAFLKASHWNFLGVQFDSHNSRSPEFVLLTSPASLMQSLALLYNTNFNPLMKPSGFYPIRKDFWWFPFKNVFLNSPPPYWFPPAANVSPDVGPEPLAKVPVPSQTPGYLR